MVTADGAIDVNELLTRILADPLALCAQVLQQFLSQLAEEYTPRGDDVPVEETIAVALGNRLARMVVGQYGPTAARWLATEDEPASRSAYDELLETNTALAAALGACDCWGEHDDCPTCRGHGAPGWIRPDRELFVSYVHPALSALTRDNGKPVVQGTDRDRKEDGDV
jgi:hypothetical protein